MKIRIYRKAYLILYLIITCVILHGQDCNELLMSYISEMESYQKPINSKVYFMHIYISSVPAYNSTIRIPDVDSRMYITEKAYFYDSDIISIYGDSKEIIYLNHNQKQIIRTNPGEMGNNQAIKIDALSKMQQELVSTGSILGCRDTVINTVKNKIITLVPSREIQTKYKINRLTYNYLSEADRIGKVKIEYANQSTLSSQTIEYKELSFDYPQWKYSSANSIVFDNAGKVRSKYAKYSLIDNVR